MTPPIHPKARTSTEASPTEDRAIADYTEAIRLDPKYAKAHFKRGNVYAEKAVYDTAIANYTEAIKLDPKYASAYYNRGFVYHDKGSMDVP